jgi:hypothetical protein
VDVVDVLGGRAETQSWTRRDTAGFTVRLWAFLERGSEVMIMAGPEGRDEPEGKEWAGRKV